MKVLVTAGSTEVPIDKVRALGNIFKGKTGASIASYFSSRGADVTLLTSASPHTLDQLEPYRFIRFRTFDELHNAMEREICSGAYDTVIHSAAVSDYKISEVLIKEGENLKPLDRTGKISSSHKEMYLKLVPTIKIIDQIREPWKFRGTIVKFKLQVGIPDDELIAIAHASMIVSMADLIVANCLEWAKERAYIIGVDGVPQNVTRAELPDALWRRLK